MSLFFFDTRDNEDLIDDDVGHDYPDLEAVKVAATRALTELARDVIPGRLRHKLSVEVRDDLGPVLMATMTFEAVILRQT